MGYSHGKRWSEEDIISEIFKIMKVLDIDRMPSSVEIERVIGNTSLSNVIAKRGGFKKWANKLNLKQSKCETRLGLYGEEKVKSILEDKGYIVEKMSVKHPYDLLVNGNIKIDVKISNKYTNRSGWSSYSFNLEKKNPTCDIYVLICNDDNKKLVIPSKFLKQTQVCITDKESKYDVFENRWEYVEVYNKFYKWLK